jgi:hypothetical protein
MNRGQDGGKRVRGRLSAAPRRGTAVKASIGAHAPRPCDAAACAAPARRQELRVLKLPGQVPAAPPSRPVERKKETHQALSVTHSASTKQRRRDTAAGAHLQRLDQRLAAACVLNLARER